MAYPDTPEDIADALKDVAKQIREKLDRITELENDGRMPGEVEREREALDELRRQRGRYQKKMTDINGWSVLSLLPSVSTVAKTLLITALLAGGGWAAWTFGRPALIALMATAAPAAADPQETESAAPRQIVTYKLVKTKVTKQLPGEAPQESEVNGSVTSLDLATTQPGFTSTGTLSIKVPPAISGDQTPFTVRASIAASWNLKATAYNLNVAVDVLGVGKANAKGDPNDPWPTAGNHSLSVENAKETSLATDGMVRKWTENGKNYRSFQVGGHTGVVQTLSSGAITFIYEEAGAD